MSFDVKLREYEDADVGALCSLWESVFGDKPELIQEFFRLLPGMGFCAVAELDGEIVGMASVLTALELVTPGGDAARCGYVYAVAVKPEVRGKGAGTALMKHCRRMFSRLCTLPASEGLYSWYADCLGADKVSRCIYETIAAKASDVEIKNLSSAEYAAMRSEYKLNTAFPLAWYEYQRELCRYYGGGMFRSGRSIACGYLEDGVLKIKECLGPTDLIPELCRRLGAEKAEIRTAFHAGKPFIAASFPLPETLNMCIALD